MNKKLETLLDALLYRSPVQPLFLWRASRRLVVLAYHGIEDPNQFEQHVNFIVQSMHPVSLDDVLKALSGDRGLPEKAVLVTFDDGDRTLFDVCRPILKQRGVPAVGFVVSGLLDTQNAPWWHQVKELARNGGNIPEFPFKNPEDLVRLLKGVPDEQRLTAIEELQRTSTKTAKPLPQLKSNELPILESCGISIGNHSHTHPCFPSCSTEKISQEIYRSHEKLTKALGHGPKSFAFPNGDSDERTVPLLRSLEYELAFLFDHRISPWPPPQAFQISRVRVNSTTRMDRFCIILSGLHPAIQRARVAVSM